MKKVRTSIAMLGYPSCSILEVDDDDAASLISGGFAEPSSGPAVNIAQADAEAELELEVADEPAATETTDAPAGVETADEPAATETTDLRKLRKPELVAIAEARGVDSTGSVRELLERLS